MIRALLTPPAVPVRVSAGLLVLRLFAGYAFMVHGWGKIQKPFSWMPEGAGVSIPGVFQALAALAEFGGGLAWILGLLMPVASFGLACTMAVAVFMHAGLWKQPLIAQGPGPNAEPAAVYFCIAVLLFLAGPGRFSADHVVFKPAKA